MLIHTQIRAFTSDQKTLCKKQYIFLFVPPVDYVCIIFVNQIFPKVLLILYYCLELCLFFLNEKTTLSWKPKFCYQLIFAIRTSRLAFQYRLVAYGDEVVAYQALARRALAIQSRYLCQRDLFGIYINKQMRLAQSIDIT